MKWLIQDEKLDHLSNYLRTMENIKKTPKTYIYENHNYLILYLKTQQIKSKKDFQREVTKQVSAIASSVSTATGAGFLGAFVGQIIYPIPVLGAVIGGTVGGVLGGFVGLKTGSAVSGKIFDAVTDK